MIKILDKEMKEIKYDDEEYQENLYPLDNFSPYGLIMNGMFFPTGEHAFQYLKFADTNMEIADKIINASSPDEARAIAQENKKQRPLNWADLKYYKMEYVFKLKAVQNPKVREILEQTDDLTIAECCVDEDTDWGLDKTFQGENHLGKIWMKVRDDLKKNHNMIVIYDFDGTLTPYSLPQYEILKQCHYTDESIMKRVKEEMANNQSINSYEAYYKCYIDILLENNYEITRNNICLGSDKVKFNNGVITYFDNYQCSNTGIKHYIVTSGVQDYVEETNISKYVDGIYGVTFMDNGIDYLLTDRKKVDVIKGIQQDNNNTTDIIYFGDGLTDKDAFEYVKSIGGKNVFIISNNQAEQAYQILNTNGIIDECFEADYSLNSSISKYIQKCLVKEQERNEIDKRFI